MIMKPFLNAFNILNIHPCCFQVKMTTFNTYFSLYILIVFKNILLYHITFIFNITGSQ